MNQEAKCIYASPRLARKKGVGFANDAASWAELRIVPGLQGDMALAWYLS